MLDFHKHTHHSYTDAAERCLLRYDLRPQLPAIRHIPALLVYSPRDREVPLDHGCGYARSLEQAELRLVDRAHELVPFGFEGELRRWLLAGS